MLNFIRENWRHEHNIKLIFVMTQTVELMVVEEKEGNEHLSAAEINCNEWAILCFRWS